MGNRLQGWKGKERERTCSIDKGCYCVCKNNCRGIALSSRLREMVMITRQEINFCHYYFIN